MGGVPHHQGNWSLSAYAQTWVIFFVFSFLFIYSNTQFSLLVIIFVFSSQSQAHQGQKCNEFMAYALAHKGKATAPEVTCNPADGPEAYTNASVHSKLSEYTSAASVSNLTEIRARSTSSSLPIRSWQQSSQQQMTEL
jgi:hypothetical protein